MEIIHLVEHSDLPITRTLDELDVPRSSFYRWYQKYQEEGYDGLADSMSRPHQFWTASQTSCGNKSSRLRWHMLINHPGNWHGTSPIQKGISSLNRGVCGHRAVRRILKGFDLVASPVFMMGPAKDKVEKPTKRVNELWQTDFTHLKVHGWGWYYLSTVLDDYSRYILAWKLSKTMAAGDVRDTLELALAKTNLERVKVRHHPRLLSDNGPCYVSHELKRYLRRRRIEHIRGAPYRPMTQGKIERYHQSMKNVVKLQNYYYPWELEQAIEDFVGYYNHSRYHEALDNLTPEDVYFGRVEQVKIRRELIKEKTMQKRRVENLQTVCV